MNCPKCNAAMGAVKFKDVEVDRCSSCEGLWFDLLEHEDLKKLKGAAGAVDTGQASLGERMDATRRIDCPKCHTRMISVHVPDQPHIVIETCTVCDGVFMDAGEFTDFAHYTLADFLKSFRNTANHRIRGRTV